MYGVGSSLYFVLLQLSFQVAPPAPAVAAPAAAAVPVVVDDSKEGREKRAKNISKKLKAIQEIRNKQAAGQPLEPEQVRIFAGIIFIAVPIFMLTCARHY